MGYTNNPTAIDKVEKFLALMVGANENLEWETAEPSKLAYYIREGISASCTLYGKQPEDERLKEFSNLKSKFIIKIKENHVIASLRNEIPLAVMSVKKLRVIHLPNVISLTEVVGAIAKYILEEEKEQIKIPNSSLTETEFKSLVGYIEVKELRMKADGNELIISKES